MGGMQVGGRAQAPMTTVGGQPGPGQGQGVGQGAQAQGMSQAATGTQAAEGAQLTGGGAVEGGKGKGRGKGKGKGRGGEGFQLPPGLAGRSYEQLPPGIRKKMSPPQLLQSDPRQGGCAMHGGDKPSGDKPAGEKPKSGVDGAAGAAPAKAPGKPSAEDTKMEQYLRDLAEGEVGKEQEPEGFREWARVQMLQGTEQPQAATQAAPAQGAPSAPPAPAGTVPPLTSSVAPTQA